MGHTTSCPWGHRYGHDDILKSYVELVQNQIFLTPSFFTELFTPSIPFFLKRNLIALSKNVNLQF